MNNFEIVRLSADNISNLRKLYKAVYGKDRPSDYFIRKYNSSYTKVEYVGYFALDKGFPVAFYGVIPTFVSMNNEIVLAAQSIDTMTHPHFKKQGLFIKLANTTFELAKKEGIHFVFGFPNQNSYPGFINKLGFVHLETINRYTKYFKDSFLKKCIRKILPANRIEVSLSNILLSEGYNGVVYDQNYFLYKKYNQICTANIKDQLIWYSGSKDIKIGALYSLGTLKVDDVITFCDNGLKSTSVTFMVSPGTELNKAISKICEVKEGFPVIVKNLTGVFTFEKLKFQFADIDIF